LNETEKDNHAKMYVMLQDG